MGDAGSRSRQPARCLNDKFDGRVYVIPSVFLTRSNDAMSMIIDGEGIVVRICED